MYLLRIFSENYWNPIDSAIILGMKISTKTGTVDLFTSIDAQMAKVKVTKN